MLTTPSGPPTLATSVTRGLAKRWTMIRSGVLPQVTRIDVDPIPPESSVGPIDSIMVPYSSNWVLARRG
jgi:hypothetical protein